MTKIENQEGYDLWSETYDHYPNPTVAIDDRMFPPFYRAHVRGDVLEIGCGTGRHTRRLAPGSGTVTAIDPSGGMLTKARANTAESNVQFQQIGIDEFRPGKQFDAIVMSLVLEHVADLTTFFKKARALLKPGGHFCFSEIHPERAAKGILAHFRGADGRDIHLTSYAHTETAIKEAATDAGFKIEKIQNVCGDEELATTNEKWRKHLHLPLIQLWDLTSTE